MVDQIVHKDQPDECPHLPLSSHLQQLDDHSTSSSSSIGTKVDHSDDEEDIHARIRRRETQIASVPLSYLDLLRGLFFGLKRLRKRLGATMESRSLGVPDEEIYDDRDCEYILTVTAYPLTPSEHLRQRAKCVLDTGCLQGNIISRRLATSLGYTEYEKLTHREKNGGAVATGHTHHVLGAVRVSWSHGSSTEVIRGMRFLVSENDHLDLVVGARSIRKWNLISPPNLGMTDITKDSNPDREALAGEEAKTAREVKKYERRLKDLSVASPDREKVEKRLRAAKKVHQAAQEKFNAYNSGDVGKKTTQVAKPVKSSRGELKESKGQGKPNPKL